MPANQAESMAAQGESGRHFLFDSMAAGKVATFSATHAELAFYPIEVFRTGLTFWRTPDLPMSFPALQAGAHDGNPDFGVQPTLKVSAHL